MVQSEWSFIINRMESVYAADFGPFGDRIWLNCAHQGPLPRVAVSAAQEAIRQKTTPHLIGDDNFTAVPNALKASLARLIGADPQDIILGNSASYGLHLLRNGIRWQAGDEVLLVQGDFPATIYPWLGLQDCGVRVRLLTPQGLSLSPAELKGQITSSTRLLCVSWINSFDGSVLDLSGIGQLCREHGVIFAVNGSQGVGALPLNIQSEAIDALVSCGYKWLCGPYGTGFCWMRPELRDRLRCVQTYWLPQVWEKESLTDYTLRENIGSEAFDVFCTANFLNFMPWQASIDYLLAIGVAAVERHNRPLLERLVNGISKRPYRLISPLDRASQSTIVAISHLNQQRNSEVHAALAAAGIDVALRSGNLRVSPHVYNTADEIDQAVSILNSMN